MNDLVGQLSDLTGLASEFIWHALYIFMRIGSAMSFTPAFGEQSVPARFRLIIAGSFSLIVLPAVPQADLPATLSISGLLSEVVVGLILGLSLRLFVLALQTAGAIAAQATSLSQMFGDAGPEPQPALTNLLVIAALALAVSAGLHVKLATFFVLTYDLFPMGAIPDPADVAAWGVEEISRGFALAFSIAAPFTIASLLYNITLGVINKAMPALMVSFIGAPALTLGALILMAVSVPLGLYLWLEAFQTFLANPFTAAP